MTDFYKSCKLCPRNCGTDRLAGKKGFCGETAALRIAAALIHFGEEPPLVGTGGSGTIFISGCNLGCAFCQNWQISQNAGADGGKSALGREVCTEEFVKICAALRDKGAENVNIVTGSHAVPGIARALAAAKDAGVRLPVLWNSSGYESAEALELINEHVDIYLPDLKTLDGEIAAKFFNAPDYPKTAAAAILKMIETGKKVIVRHLILPGFPDSTRAVLRWFADNAAGSGGGQSNTQLSLMTQYTPIPGRNRPMRKPHSGLSYKFPIGSHCRGNFMRPEGGLPDGFLTEEDYKTVIGWLEEFNIEDGFCQELVTGTDWLPDFTRANPFSSELSKPVWHYTTSRT
jgi:putative pyruvate formate lyase activating enzyme